MQLNYKFVEYIRLHKVRIFKKGAFIIFLFFLLKGFIWLKFMPRMEALWRKEYGSKSEYLGHNTIAYG